ncbi:hypothetical protein [Stenotrophomonas sp. 22385]|uniref:hypothetical protein n=1 Tax=Stenotrophomonas sp. 22385 TaxID=3453915 RepID=UPI003F828977
MTSITTFVDSISESIKSFNKFCVVVYWLQDDTDREGIFQELSVRLAGTRLLPHVLRTSAFQDPNAWASDAMSILSSLRSDILNLDDDGHESPLGVVVISRGKMNVAQASSPAIAPDWLPGHGGREVIVFARDVRLISTCSLSAEEACIDSIKSSLFGLEHALLKIVRTKFETERHFGQKLWDQVLRERSRLEKKSQFPDYWSKGLDSVTDPSSYRPSLTSGWSMISAMWDTFLSASPSQLLAKSDAFREYLTIGADWLPSSPDPSPLFPIMFRGPEDHRRSVEELAARGVVLSVGLSCQLTTASAHADQYGRVSASTLSGLSQDLRRTLAAAERQAGWTAQAATRNIE